MSTGLVKAIKQASLDAVESGQPTDVRYGKVTSVNPLKIQVNPQLTIPESVLVVPERLKNELYLNDQIALLRQKGGQSYLILDNLTRKTGGEVVTDHGDLTGRDAVDQHPISSVTKLQTELDTKFDSDDIITNLEIFAIMNN